jgi:putative restriction endonuclease
MALTQKRKQKMMPTADLDAQFRLSAFAHLDTLVAGQEDAPVYWQDLVRFEFNGRRSPLIGQRGIWKPAALETPISITTAPPKPNKPAPYDDEVRGDDTIVYRYQGSDPDSHDNIGLRILMWERKPLIYFHGIEKGVYLAAWPVFITDDNPAKLSVTVDLSPSAAAADHVAESVYHPDARQYVYMPTKKRLHQAKFRVRIMRAYRRRCCICRLGHERLLDAAHIIPDAHDAGLATTQNGLSLCKIHHAAFDSNILGIDPDLMIHVRKDILAEIDGPMLQHGIKEMHGERLAVLPRRREDQPSLEGLSERYRMFRRA